MNAGARCIAAMLCKQCLATKSWRYALPLLSGSFIAAAYEREAQYAFSLRNS